ncbi:Uncharacterised protein [Chlamydia trachomatis]|nr:Uncharacterised protein [Chlamydia trachomatis]
MQCILFTVDDDSVTGVVTAVELHDIVSVLAELVGRLTFTFIAPLGTEHDHGWHGSLPDILAIRTTVAAPRIILPRVAPAREC